MTYIVGLKYQGHAAILCDSRVSFSGAREPENTWLKSGLLFPGCIYAYAGDVDSAHKFIIAAKRVLTGYGTLESFWDRFILFVREYPFSEVKEDGFDLLLSSRNQGPPTLYVLDSTTRTVRQEGDIVTLGSGRELLDYGVRNTYAHLEHILPIEIRALHPAIVPANLCLQLMERAQGYEASALNEAGVGGYFHFSYQSKEDESRQPPTLYVLCDPGPERNLIATWAFRIAYCEAALVVECPVRQQRDFILDPAAWPRALEMTDHELEALHQDLNEKTMAQPFYNIAGFGVSNPAFRRRNPMVVPKAGDYLIDRTGRTSEKFNKMVHATVADDAGAAAIMSGLQLRQSPSG